MIQSFNQVRLTSQMVNASGGALSVNGVNVVMQTQTGSFITSGQTGLFYAASNPAGYISTGALTGYVQSSATGAFITTGQTGAFLGSASFNTFTGNSQNFITSISTGINSQFIAFPFNFASVPKVVTSMEVTSNFVYNMVVSSRTISGYTALLSDTVAETGVSLHTYATVNN